MQNVNPFIHLDHEYMWRWYEIDDHGQIACLSSKAFFSREDCRRDYESVMHRQKRGP